MTREGFVRAIVATADALPDADALDYLVELRTSLDVLILRVRDDLREATWRPPDE